MKEYLEEKVAAALAAIGAPDGTDAAVERPKTIEHGDLATSVALPLARVLKKAPRAIADDLVAALDFEERYVAKVDVAGPGFINITLTSAFYHDRLADALADPDSFCATSSGAGERVNVEYVSANPTGPLHPGHGRNAALGDTIANMLAASGRDVTREYYFNNAGNQMRNLARSIHSRYRTLLELPTTFPEDGYHGDYIVDIARAIVDEQGDALAEETDENIDRMRSFGEEWNFRMIRKTMDLLGIAHDHFFNEKSLYETGRIKETIAKLGELGKTYEKEEALYIRLDEIGRDDRVIVKSSGEPTYRLPDIAYHVEKLSRGFDRVIDVLGADHIDAVPDVIAAVGMLGGPSERVTPVIHQMVSFVEGGEQVKMSKRSGKAITLDSLIEELGADVVRFFFVMRGASTHLEFDLDLAREQSEKNPVFYLQYAHARISGVLRHAEQEGIAIDPEASLEPLESPEEIDVIRQILFWPETLDRAARDLEPVIVAEYLRELAAAFHKFYHDHRVVGADTEAEQSARLRLLEMTRRVIAAGLGVLGVAAPERM